MPDYNLIESVLWFFVVRPLGTRGVSNMHENGLLLGLNDHQLNQSFQQEYTPRVTSMQPANNAYYSQSLLPATMIPSAGKLTNDDIDIM